MLNKDDNIPRLHDVHAGGDHAEDGVDVGADHGHAGKEVVEVVGLTETVAQLLNLDEAARATNDGQSQNGNLGPGEDPEHLVRKLNVVLHNEEDDENDDSTDQTEESKEESLAGALAVHPPVSASPALLGVLVIVVHVLKAFALNLEDLVVSHVLPHDIGDGGSDETEMQFQLDPAN